MAARQSIQKKIRFEVFKRDSFSCQYCGAKAPDVLLVIDHVKPVARGGDNDPMNLVTSCQACNAGKGARELDDDSVLARQRVQIEELNERRVQIEMMLEWRDQLLDLEKLKADKLSEIIHQHAPVYSVNESGRQHIERWIKRYDFNELLDATDAAFNQYWRSDEEDQGRRSENWNRAFNAIPGVIRVTKQLVEKPYLKQLYYIRGILRNRLGDESHPGWFMNILERCAQANVDLDHLQEAAKRYRSWRVVENELFDFLGEHEDAK